MVISAAHFLADLSSPRMNHMDRPIVLCGLGRVGTRVLEYLRAAGLPVVVIDTVCQPGDPRLAGATLISGDCRRREVLEAAGVVEARGILVLTNDDQLNISTALMVRTLHKEIRIVVRMFNQNLLARLGKAVFNVFALSTSLLTAPILATAALTGQALGTYRVDDSPTGLLQVAELTVGPSLAGKSLGSLTQRGEVVVVAHVPNRGEVRHLHAVQAETQLNIGDRLVLCGSPARLTPLLLATEDDEQLRWATLAFRLARMVRQTIAEMDLAVLICTIVVIVVLLISTLVFHLGVPKYNLADAFLRSVSVMATGAPLREEDYQNAPGIRIYAGLLRLLGAVLLAAFTAIVTNYLLRARLGGVLEVRRIPESGHIIVCGLSTVGFRVMEELLRLGERVVVIEQDSGNRFVTTARRLGAAVMIGDASVVEVLRQAHAATARAVLPATNHDITNLEVALLVRELDAQARVVVLITDPQFAQMLREAADIRLALSVPALAAPAFMAALFGDRVLGVFSHEGKLFATLDLVIQPEDPFIGQVLRGLAIDYDLLPVALMRNGQQVDGALLANRLEAGDRVVGLVAFSDLERLLRRQPCPAACGVLVEGCPLPILSWLAGLLRMTRGLNAVEADQAVQQMPLLLASGLTRGQAEDLLAQLGRQRVHARRIDDSTPYLG
jgi:Trk K+ transport system NAD-binding subunit